MKVLYLVRDLEMGGITSVVTQNAFGLEKQGCNIIIFSLREAKFNKIGNNIKVISGHAKSKLGYLGAFIRFINIIREFSPDIIHSHHIPTHMFLQFYALIVPKSSNVKIINQHGTLNSRNGKQWIAFKMLRSKQCIYVNVSRASLNSYIKYNVFPMDRSFVIYNGVDVDLYKRNHYDRAKIRNEILSGNEKVIISVIARLSPEKDVSNFIKAYANIWNDESKVLIIGDGEEKGNLLKLVEDKNIINKVVFLGEKNRDETRKYLSATDILVIPSKTEGLPTVALEAMSCECIVVSTNCGGINEIFDGVQSFICEIENPNDLSKKIKEALELDINKRTQYGYEYRNRIISQFSSDKISENLILFYNMLREMK